MLTRYVTHSELRAAGKKRLVRHLQAAGTLPNVDIASALHPRQARAAHHRAAGARHFEALQGARERQKT